MRQLRVSAVAAAALMMSAGMAMADARVTLDVASANVFRGATLNDGLVVQPGLEVALHGLTLGAWGNLDLDDYDGTVEKNQFGEIDLYASYAIPVDVATLSVGYIEYTYPGTEVVEADREVNVGVGLDVLLSPHVTVSYGVDGSVDKSWHVGAGIGHSIGLAEGFGLDLGATVAWVDPDEGKSGFADYTVTAGLSHGIFAASVTYIGQIDDKVLPDDVYDVEVVGKLSLAIDL
jgi:uncharacterized protein (TIGR02001 family)